MLGFILQNSKITIAVLIALIAVQGYFNYQQQVSISTLNTTLKQVSKDLETANNKVTLLETKEKIREQEIASWRLDALNKEIELSKLTNELTQKQIEVDNLSKDKWEKAEFTNDCKKDIQILKSHAIELKGKW